MPNKGDIIDNPSTGESRVFDGTGWVRHYDPGMEPPTKGESFSMGATQALSAPARAVAKVANAVATSGAPAGRGPVDLFPGLQLDTTDAYSAQMNQNPGSAAAGQLVGSVPALVGAGMVGATAPATLAAQSGVFGTAGALMEPDHPLMGALMGVAGVFGGTALSHLANSSGAGAIVDKVRQVVKMPTFTESGRRAEVAAMQQADEAATAALGGRPPVMGSPGEPAAQIIPGAPAARPVMGSPGEPAAPIIPGAPPLARQGRQAGSTGGAGGASRGDLPETRMLPGYMLPEELAAIGIPRVTPGSAKALYSRDTATLAGAEATRDAEEIAARAGGLSGRLTNDIRDEQLRGLTNYTKREMGIPETDARVLTPTRVSDLFNEMGNRYREIMRGVNIQPDQIPTLRGNIASVLEGSTSESERLVKAFSARFETDVGGGMLTNEKMRGLDHFLQKQIANAQAQGELAKVADGQKLRGALLNIIQDAAPPGTHETIKTWRRQYAIASSLQGRGMIAPGGIINPVAFNSAWNKNKHIAPGVLAQDNLGRAIETVTWLTSKQTPSSGTTEGIIRNMAGQAGKSLLSAATGGAL